jgi:hypothetical protein
MAMAAGVVIMSGAATAVTAVTGSEVVANDSRAVGESASSASSVDAGADVIR